MVRQIEHFGCEDGTKGLQAKECRQPVEARKGLEADGLLAPLEGYHTLS